MPRALSRLARRIGVTRVARVTALDRAGVEVACAVRPGGHVLQVTNGKGATFDAAARGALAEAAELWCAERADLAPLRWAPAAALRREGLVLDAAALGGDAGEDVPVAWRGGVDLVTGGRAFVPAAAVHAPPPGGPALGLTGLRWTSNGMGAHPEPARALLHALHEAAERDGLARALPDGWTEDAAATCALAPEAITAVAPRLGERAAALERNGLSVRVFDLTERAHRNGDSSSPRPRGAGRGRTRSRRAPPLAAALLFDRTGGPQPLTAGYACRATLAEALQAAFLEAAQSRLTDIHGAREDVEPCDAEGAARLWAACAAPGSRPARGGRLSTVRPRQVPAPRRPAAAVEAVVRALLARGVGPVVALQLAPEDLGMAVVKVVAPGLLLSELLG